MIVGPARGVDLPFALAEDEFDSKDEVRRVVGTERESDRLPSGGLVGEERADKGSL